MPELQERDAKLIQYLNEAYGKEKELETSLQAHIQMTSRDTYKKRLKDHLKETKAQSRGLKQRIKQLGGKAEATPVQVPGPDAVGEAAEAATSLANKAMAAAKGPLHAVRGTSEQEKMLKNAKTEFWNEHEEIANYNAIETLAEAVGDKETAKLAREYRRQEERMAKFLEKTIPQLTKEVVKAEIPASQRNGGRRTRRSGGSRASARSGSSSRSAASSRSGSASSRSSAGSSRSSSSSSRSGKKTTAAAKKTTAAAKRTTGAAKTGRSSPAKRSSSSSRSRSSASRGRARKS
jgi:ferritin-like metal-binding protein YciE